MISANIDNTLAALADPIRRQVIDLLKERPHRPGELATATHMSPPAMSRHLKVLRTRGLIVERRIEEDARVRLFQLRREPFEELQAWLKQMEKNWTEQLEAFKAYAESTRRKAST